MALLACSDKISPSDDSRGADTACETRWYEDGDSDGHGDPEVWTERCEAPAFWVAAGDDCDDTDASARPGAEETCDGVDDDCDGEIDEGLEHGTWWEDADGDGYGDPTSEVSGCAPPEHPSDNGEDCDDQDASTFPGASETCGDGAWNDCGALTEGCELVGERSLSGATAALYGEAEDARAGQALVGAGDTDGDGWLDLWVAAPEDPEGGLSAGAVYLVRGPLVGEQVLSEATAKLVGERASAYTGLALAAGDTDLDGLPDLLVGAPGVPTTGGQGLAALVLGPVTGALGLEDADQRLLGPEGSGLLGGALALADLDGDASPELLIGDPYGQTAGVAAGWVALAPSDAESLDEAPRLWGEAEGDYAGVAMASGDLDGDGILDLAVGAAYQSEAGAAAGATYLRLGPVSAEGALDSEVRWLGEDEGDFAGRALAVGDLDGDGLDDLVIGGAGSDAAGDGAGAIWAIPGPASGGGSLVDAPARWLGEREHDAAGQELALAGDVDQDGLPDLLVGAPGEDTAGAFAGAAYLLCGPLSGSASLESATAKITGIDVNDSAGIAVAGPGDLDADGRADLGVGAYAVDIVADWAGAAYLVPGAGY